MVGRELRPERQAQRELDLAAGDAPATLKSGTASHLASRVSSARRDGSREAMMDMPRHLTHFLTLLTALVSGATSTVYATQPSTPPLELIVLGSGGPGATGRAASSYLILIDGVARILLDAGPGSFARLGEAKVASRHRRDSQEGQCTQAFVESPITGYGRDARRRIEIDPAELHRPREHGR